MAKDLFLLIGRLMLAGLFIQSGYAALSNISGTAAYFDGLGMPFAELLPYGVGSFELIAGLMLIIGFLTRPAAALLAAFALVAGFLGHYGQAENAFLHQQMLMKDIAVAGGLVVLAIQGAGRISVDARNR